MFSFAFQRNGKFVSADTPWLDGPRNCGQFSAVNSTAKSASPARTVTASFVYDIHAV
jgi:hypothetical protein